MEPIHELIIIVIAGVIAVGLVVLLVRPGRSAATAKPALKSVQTISEARLQEMFLAAPENPLFLATLAALDLQVQEELDTCIEESLTNEVLRFRIGGVAGLLRFKANLQDRETEARRMRTETEEQGAPDV